MDYFVGRTIPVKLNQKLRLAEVKFARELSLAV